MIKAVKGRLVSRPAPWLGGCLVDDVGLGVAGFSEGFSVCVM